MLISLNHLPIPIPPVTCRDNLTSTADFASVVVMVTDVNDNAPRFSSSSSSSSSSFAYDLLENVPFQAFASVVASDDDDDDDDYDDGDVASRIEYSIVGERLDGDDDDDDDDDDYDDDDDSDSRRFLRISVNMETNEVRLLFIERLLMVDTRCLAINVPINHPFIFLFFSILSRKRRWKVLHRTYRGSNLGHATRPRGQVIVQSDHSGER